MRDNKRYFNRNSVHSFLVVTYLDKIRLPFRLTGKNICKCGNLKKNELYNLLQQMQRREWIFDVSETITFNVYSPIIYDFITNKIADDDD